MFLLQRHHITGRAMSHSNMPRGCVVLVMLRPRHMLVPKLKRRCCDTHFHSMLPVGLPQSSSTSLEPSTVMQLFSCLLSRMNRPFSAAAWVEKKMSSGEKRGRGSRVEKKVGDSLNIVVEIIRQWYFQQRSQCDYSYRQDRTTWSH